MLVKDKQSGDYAFLSGGVKSNETVMRAAARELNEETYGAITEEDLSVAHCVKQIEFKNSFRPQHRDEDVSLRKKLGQHLPNGVVESCTVVVFEIPQQRIPDIIMAYSCALHDYAKNKEMVKYMETSDVIFEDIKSVTKWERDQMRGNNSSPDANGIHLWDVHVKNGVAMRVRSALM